MFLHSLVLFISDASASAALALSAASPSFRVSRLNWRLRVHHLRALKCGSRSPPRVLQPFSIFQHLVEDLHPLQLPILHLLQIMLDPGRLELELGSILGAVLARMVGGSITMKQGTQKLSESEGLQCLLQHLLVLLQGLYLAVEQLVALCLCICPGHRSCENAEAAKASTQG